MARLLSSVAGKEWTEAMVAHAERSVTGNRVREFTADDLVTLARAFDVPVLYFLTPPPKGIFVHVPGSRIDTITMLEAVLGRVDNLAEWETLLDEWNFAKDEELPFPLSERRRQQIHAMAGEVAADPGPPPHPQALQRQPHGAEQHSAIPRRPGPRRRRHEVLADLDEDEQIRQIEAMRADIAKGNRIAEAGQQFFEDSVAEWEEAQKGQPKKRRRTPMSRNSAAAPRRDPRTAHMVLRRGRRLRPGRQPEAGVPSGLSDQSGGAGGT